MVPKIYSDLSALDRPVSLISSIMKLLERVIEQGLPSHLEQIGFINKHQSGFRRAKSTCDHIFSLFQSITESFNRGEHNSHPAWKIATLRILLKPDKNH